MCIKATHEEKKNRIDPKKAVQGLDIWLIYGSYMLTVSLSGSDYISCSTRSDTLQYHSSVAFLCRNSLHNTEILL